MNLTKALALFPCFCASLAADTCSAQDTDSIASLREQLRLQAQQMQQLHAASSQAPEAEAKAKASPLSLRIGRSGPRRFRGPASAPHFTANSQILKFSISQFAAPVREAPTFGYGRAALRLCGG